tara:strand:+ start:101 stop:358 length:258 start_codon:yes stop_codon:yes gene_type:complete
MSWKVELVSFAVFILAGAVLVFNGCLEIEPSPTIQRFDLDATAHREMPIEIESYLPIEDGQVQKTEYIVMDEMHFNVNLADDHQR